MNAQLKTELDATLKEAESLSRGLNSALDKMAAQSEQIAELERKLQLKADAVPVKASTPDGNSQELRTLRMQLADMSMEK